MATSSARLKTAIASRLKGLYREEGPDDEAQNEDYFLDQMAGIIAEEVLAEITGHAKCSGEDSHGDTHGNVSIV